MSREVDKYQMMTDTKMTTDKSTLAHTHMPVSGQQTVPESASSEHLSEARTSPPPTTGTVPPDDSDSVTVEHRGRAEKR
eukprot:scaffold4700_cov45-Attheya_sp.AAC.1